MENAAIPNYLKLKNQFENKVAIYREGGAIVKVRVSNIQSNLSKKYISADVETIDCLGLPIGLKGRYSCFINVQWNIGGGPGTRFSKNTWSNGPYFSWSIYFDELVIKKIESLVSKKHSDEDKEALYRESIKIANEYSGIEQYVFSENESASQTSSIYSLFKKWWGA
jgi:hypothetical protein